MVTSVARRLSGCVPLPGTATLDGMKASDVQVRRAHPDEWATVRDVRLAALADAPDAFASTLSRERGRTEPQWRSRIGAWPWFLAWRAGTPAGLVAAVPDQPASGPPAADPPARDPRGWHLVSMWVSPQVRGTGVAELLIGAVVDHARAVGAPRITLWVALGNARARAFYLRMGFTPTGRRQAYPRDGADALDEEELARPVRSAAPPTAPP
jgi:ribosomal protein S18 acetylase RimI-like enzyme